MGSDDWPVPARPFEGDYASLHRAFIGAMIDDPRILARFAAVETLPDGFGIGLDERVVEYPWLLSRKPSGLVLDAGSTLNHEWFLDRLLPRVEALHIVTLAPEAQSFVERGVSYLFADLRDLPLRSDCYDTVVSLSTLEHVGMDNTMYGDGGGRADDPTAAAGAALTELLRVAKPDTSLFISVPFGLHGDFGWSRQLDERDLWALFEAAGVSPESVTVYGYSANGWQLSSLEEAAHLEYRHFGDPIPADRAAAARSVACIELRAAQAAISEPRATPP